MRTRESAYTDMSLRDNEMFLRELLLVLYCILSQLLCLAGIGILYAVKVLEQERDLKGLGRNVAN